MKIALFDFIGFSYDHHLIEERAAGGTQALAATLAYYLAAAGHSVTFLTPGNHCYRLDGVDYIGLDHNAANPDVGIVVGLPDLDTVTRIRDQVRGGRLILWWHGNRMAPEQCAIADAFDHIVMVSNYAVAKNTDQIADRRIQPISNFLPLLPPLLDKFSQSSCIEKKEPNLLAYIGNITRGLENVPAILEKLRHRGIDFRIRIFSGSYLYYPHHVSSAAEPALLDECREDPNVDFVVKVGKRDLLDLLQSASIMVMPNAFNESFCLSLIEAMYMELMPVATNRSAIPETAGGFAYLAPVSDAQTDDKFSGFDPDIYVDILCDVVCNAKALRPKLIDQKLYVLDRFHPRVAVSRWLEFL
jgi:glycosyltransferase involved in cell wall biosynthesis